MKQDRKSVKSVNLERQSLLLWNPKPSLNSHFNYKNTSWTKQDTESKSALLKSFMLIHQNKWKKCYSFQDHVWTRSKKHSFSPLRDKELFFMQQLVPELQWELWMNKRLIYIHCLIMIYLLPTRTCRSRYYISDHISNYNNLVSHFWQWFFRKFLSALSIRKVFNFHSRWQLINFTKGHTPCCSAREHFNARKLINFMFLNEQYHQGCKRSVFHQKCLNLLFRIANREK